MKKPPDWAIGWKAQREAHLDLDMESEPMAGLEKWLVKAGLRLAWMISMWWHQHRHHKPH